MPERTRQRAEGAVHRRLRRFRLCRRDRHADDLRGRSGRRARAFTRRISRSRHLGAARQGAGAGRPALPDVVARLGQAIPVRVPGAPRHPAEREVVGQTARPPAPNAELPGSSGTFTKAARSATCCPRRVSPHAQTRGYAPGLRAVRGTREDRRRRTRGVESRVPR